MAEDQRLWNFKISPSTKLSVDDLNGLYCIGLFETENITISQQIKRAETLAQMICKEVDSSEKTKIAVVGGGFAGLSFILEFKEKIGQKKGVEIHLFEKSEQLCPVQRGCSIRKYYEEIHQWPNQSINDLYGKIKKDSEADPKTNGIIFPSPTVGDIASAKVSAVLKLVHDKRTAENGRGLKLFVYQNCSYLKIDNIPTVEHGLCLTVSGDKLKDPDGSLDKHTQLEQEFDIVILATGFGVEQNLDSSKTKLKTNSYWRNDDRGQTQLYNSKNTYLVSGYGDGAINDILRLKIYDFNPYQLVEIFEDKIGLNSIESQDITFESLLKCFGISNKSEEEKSEEEKNKEIKGKEFFLKFQPFVKNQVNVILHVENGLQNKNIIKEIVNSKKSFAYNRLLLFALWCCNGFTIKCAEAIESIIEEYDISVENVIIRHGSDRKKNLKSILNDDLYKMFEDKLPEALKDSSRSNVVPLPQSKKTG